MNGLPGLLDSLGKKSDVDSLDGEGVPLSRDGFLIGLLTAFS